jgi:hypothetical protein
MQECLSCIVASQTIVQADCMPKVKVPLIQNLPGSTDPRIQNSPLFHRDITVHEAIGSSEALRNGDEGVITCDSYDFELYGVSGSDSLVFGPSTSLFQRTDYNSQILAEASDGSIFFGCNSNSPNPGKDWLIKFSPSGNFVFAKTFSGPNPSHAFPLSGSASLGSS